MGLDKINTQANGKKLEDKDEKIRYNQTNAKINKKILENIEEGYYEVDLKGNFISWNKSLLEILGYEKKVIAGKNFQDFLDYKSSEQIFDLFRNVYISNQEKKNINLKIKTNNRIKKDIIICIYLLHDLDGEKIGFNGLIKDVTEWKKNEKKMKIYKFILDSVPEAIFFKDLKSHYQIINNKIVKAFGLPHEEIIGRSDNELIFNKAEAAKNMRHDQEVFSTGEIKKITKHISALNNKEYWFRAVKIPFFNKNGNINGLIGIAKDISNRKRSKSFKERFEKELKVKVKKRTIELKKALKKQERFKEELIKASRFKNEFLATMSHELRTPLNPIIGFTDLLLEEEIGNLNELQKEYLRDMRSSAEHQLEMINKILDITKIESGKYVLDKKYFSLNSILDQIKSTIKPLYTQKELKFKIKGLKDNMEIYGDPIRFKEILLNLLTNAIKYTIEGKVTLDIKELFRDWVFKVRDTGIGIAREDFDIIFKEFKRVDSTYVKSVPGTGLGLSLTKRLVELHEGNITFTSILGSGSTFTVSLPKKKKPTDMEL